MGRELGDDETFEAALVADRAMLVRPGRARAREGGEGADLGSSSTSASSASRSAASTSTTTSGPGTTSTSLTPCTSRPSTASPNTRAPSTSSRATRPVLRRPGRPGRREQRLEHSRRLRPRVVRKSGSTHSACASFGRSSVSDSRRAARARPRAGRIIAHRSRAEQKGSRARTRAGRTGRRPRCRRRPCPVFRAFHRHHTRCEPLAARSAGPTSGRGRSTARA